MTIVGNRVHPVSPKPLSYAGVGVDSEAAEAGLHRLADRIRATWPGPGIGAVKLDIGFYANVVDLGSTWLAITTDGVGTKALLAQMAGRYDTIGIDCVAMNVNDVICVGANPLSLVDYLAVERATPELIDQIAVGLVEGAKLAGVSIVGGETAQIPEMLAHGEEGIGFDLAATAVGVLEPGRLVVGDNMRTVRSVSSTTVPIRRTRTRCRAPEPPHTSTGESSRRAPERWMAVGSSAGDRPILPAPAVGGNGWIGCRLETCATCTACACSVHANQDRFPPHRGVRPSQARPSRSCGVVQRRRHARRMA